MSINTKSTPRRIIRNWRRILVVAGAILLAPSTILFVAYLAFWIGRWTVGVGIKVTKTPKREKKIEKKPEEMEQRHGGSYEPPGTDFGGI